MLRDIRRTPFALLFFGLSLVCVYPMLVFPKGDLELLINHYHTPGLDLFFKYITHLGDGTLLAILAIGALFYNYYFAIVTIFSIIMQSVVVSLFKRWIFNGMPRPTAFFPEGTMLNFVDGVDVHKINSFPSGHTATAFTFFLLLIWLIGFRRRWVSVLFFILAFCVGYSRVYLLQHFVVDVWFGALFGVVSVLLAIWITDLLIPKARIQQLSANSLRGFFGSK